MLLKRAACLLLGIMLLLSGCQHSNRTQETEQPAQTTLSPAPSIIPPTPAIRLLKNVRSVQMMDAMHGWVFTETSILRTDDGALTWKNVTPQNDGMTADMRLEGNVPQASFIQPNVAILAVPQLNNGTILLFRTQDEGQSWTKTEVKSTRFPDGTPTVTDFSFTDINTGWMLISYGSAMGSESVEIFHTNDGSANWQSVGVTVDPSHPDQPEALPFTGIKNGLSFHSLQDGWISGFWHGDGIWLYATHDGGSKWTDQPIQAPEGISVDGGAVTTYPPQFFANQKGILPIQFSLTTLIFYVSQDGGASWQATTPLRSTTDEPFVWSFADSVHGFATDGNELFYTSDGAKTWDTVPHSISYKGTLGLNFITSQNGYAYGSDWMKKTMDGGFSWQEVE
ncbi:hypothetical protein A8709_17505 [Paenibacillus pectinilyticus]|uniref:Photosynthesis system II assembly factor Ycf48/Hcf136-like domain-containing protein n=1 Tax=Paenibacillus pectinilyticus TaxID=512399 RepID=A0A1C0ZZ61_9BACL|nr:hypothetical protein [Paenibacillus pectinilyticus]OCT13408.1 hypothetical protein A8709_17505 [Paenibacillus pectinilyticus]